MLATMMRGFLRAGKPTHALTLFRRVLRDRLAIDARTIVFAVKAAATSSSPTEAIHCVAFKRGFIGQSVLAGNALVHMYTSSMLLPDARKLFDEMADRDVVSWTTLIDGYARGGLPDEAWRVFCRMVVAESVWPNEVTLVAAASAAGQMGLLGLGRTVHQCIVESGGRMSVNLENALVDMFGKCGCVAAAKEVFDGMPIKDVYSWTSMVSAYAKCGDLENAAKLFKEIPNRNVVSWSCMVAAYSHANMPDEAIRIFNDMIAAGVEPIDATLVSVLSACAQLCSLDVGTWLYDTYIVSHKVELTPNLSNAFIDMFAKCGDVGAASRLFSNMEDKNVVSWNTMIMAHGLHGQPEEALHLFQEFKGNGILPDEATYIGVLSACSHGGLVSEGRCHFKEMKIVYGIEPRAEHYACMIDLLGKVGLLQEAFEVARSMPVGADEAGWGALLNACRMHGNVEIGKCAADKLAGLDPSDSGIYVLMSQIYASKSKWGQVKMLRTVMRDRRVKKNPGCSSIEVDGKCHEFLVADVSHVHSEDIYAALGNIYLHSKAEGYISHASCVCYKSVLSIVFTGLRNIQDEIRGQGPPIAT
jgi:pentatricopeptide repeat protein